MVELFSISVYTVLTAYMGVGNLRLWAERRLLVIPNERSSHTHPTPSGGGLAIAITSLFGLFTFGLLSHHLNLALCFLMLGGVLVTLVSWLDDLYTMEIQVRLGVHALSTVCFMLGVGYLHKISLPLLGEIHLGWLGFFVTVFCVVGLINAYNFMDGIDGIAGTQAVIGGLAWALIGYWIDAPLVMALGLVLATSSLGFLGYNWPPARIFMGDVGSAFLGYSFAALIILGASYQPQLALVGCLIVWPFLFDTLFTLLRRWRRGENIFLAHRSHLYQRLVVAGHSHRTVTLLYAGLSLLNTLLALLWFRNFSGSTAAIIVGPPVMALALWLAVRHYEARPIQPSSVRQGRITLRLPLPTEKG